MIPSKQLLSNGLESLRSCSKPNSPRLRSRRPALNGARRPRTPPMRGAIRFPDTRSTWEKQQAFVAVNESETVTVTLEAPLFFVPSPVSDSAAWYGEGLSVGCAPARIRHQRPATRRVLEVLLTPSESCTSSSRARVTTTNVAAMCEGEYHAAAWFPDHRERKPASIPAYANAIPVHLLQP